MDRKTAAILIAASRAFVSCEEDRLPTNAITLWRQICEGIERAATVINDLSEK